jgi:hypothetical protein
MTTISTNTTAGIVLTTASYTNPIIITSGVTVGSATAGIGIAAGTSNTWSIQNSGVVSGGTADSAGISLGNGGYIDNAGSATITAATGPGIVITSGGGTIVNASGGLISGATGVDGLGTNLWVHNSGGISAGNGVGIYISGGASSANSGYIANTSGGAIDGTNNGIKDLGAALTIQNGGGITATAGAAIFFQGAASSAISGYIRNISGGAIAGASDGLKVLGATVTIVNSGAITGSNVAGIYISGAASSTISGYIANVSGGTIVGSDDGIEVKGADATIVNSGGVTGTGTAGAGIYLGSAASSAVSGYIRNAATGTVTGYRGVYAYRATATIINAGHIAGTEGAGIYLKDAPSSAISGYIHNASGGTITGATDGIQFVGATATIVNSGRITGTGVNDSGIYLLGAASSAISGYIGNASGGTITGFNGVYVSGATATIRNAGGIGGSVFGVDLAGAASSAVSGYISNAAGGRITGAVYAVNVQGVTATIKNAGTIAGSLFYGIELEAADSSAISGYIGNAAGATITARRVGIEAQGVTATIVNSGTIAATGTSVADAGVYLGGAASSVVTGYITNATTGLISGLTGIRVEGASASVINAGVIHGTGAAGIYLSGATTSAVSGYIGNLSGGTIAGATYGIRVAGATATIINSGGITGTSESGIYLTPARFSQVSGYVSNAATGTIAGNLDGIAADGIQVSITNAGLITGTAWSGIYLGSASSSTVTGDINNMSGGTITGGGGISVDGIGVSIHNAGVIAGTVENAIALGGAASSSVAGYVSNAATGSIGGAGGGVAAVGIDVTIRNAGSITAAVGNGIELFSAISSAVSGYVSNTSGGYIGGAQGIYVDGVGATIINAGYINTTEPEAGIKLQASDDSSVSGYVSNAATGTIAGLYGIQAAGVTATIRNAGTIAGFEGIYLSGSPSSAVSGYIGNISGGIISGYATGIDVAGLGVTIHNAGLITTFGTSTIYQGILVSGAPSSAVSGYIGNSATGTITGTGAGIQVKGASVAIQNAGLISGAANAGIYLSGAPSSAVSGYIGNTSTGTITGIADGIQAFAVDATVHNAGVITGSGTGANIAGIYLGGALSSAVSGYIGNTSAGTISGGKYGIKVDEVSATIVNAGTITGVGEYGIYMLHANANSIAISSYISNAAGGTITGHTFGIDVAGGEVSIVNAGDITGPNGAALNLQLSGTATTSGYVSNAATGTIAGGTDGIDAASASIANAGLIIGTSGSGINLQSPGWVNDSATIDNTGTITGAQDGIAVDPVNVTIDNSGVITGTSASGIYLNGSASSTVFGYVSSAVTGVVTGGVDGIDANNLWATIDNSGVVAGTSGAGINLQSSSTSTISGYVTNQATGTIAGGGNGINVYGLDATIDNAGVITGTNGSGIVLQSSGTSTNSGYIDSTGGTISGHVDGIDVDAVWGTIDNAGVISGATGSGIQFQASSTTVLSGYVSNLAGGTITGGIDGIDVGGIHATIDNSGVINGSSGSGIELQSSSASAVSGYVTNLAGGTITGLIDGVVARGIDATIDNAGVITGTSASGIALQSSSSSTVSGYVTNLASGTITGGIDGIDVGGIHATIDNAGVITGTNGSGIDLQSSVSSTVSGYVTNATTGTITGGLNGIAVRGIDAPIDNSGVITGTTTAGIYLLSSSTTNVSGYVSNASTGTITGGAYGIDAVGIDATVLNAGIVTGTIWYGIYLQFSADSTVSGYIGNASTGTITGGADGIEVFGVTATIDNAGVVTGTTASGIYFQYSTPSGITGALTNESTGTITGGTDGIKVGGEQVTIDNAGHVTGTTGSGVDIVASTSATISGYVSNASTGTITGGTDGIAVNGVGATIDNHGVITGTGGNGIDLEPSNTTSVAGYVDNAAGGTIAGGINGIYVDGIAATIDNLGVITGTVGSGLFLASSDASSVSGYVSNAAGGTITGGDDGVDMDGVDATVDNLGVITGTNGSGIELNQSNSSSVSGYVGNAAGGTITGGRYGLNLGGITATIDNAGVITGTNGSGIYLAYANDSSVSGYIGNTGSGTITGGASGIYADRVGVTIDNAGVITGTTASGIYVYGFAFGGITADVSNAAMGAITGGADGVNVANATATIENAGVITGTSGSGIDLHSSNVSVISVYVTNAMTGAITGGTNGIDAAGVYATIDNAGVITGTNGSGIALQASSTTSVSGYVGNAAGGAITGGADGIDAAGLATTIENLGVITGTSGSGIALQSSSSSTISGYVTNASGASITGGTDGIAVDPISATIMNAGVITGTSGSGIYIGTSAATGVAVYIGNTGTGTIAGGAYGIKVAGLSATIQNSGTITGTANYGIYLGYPYSTGVSGYVGNAGGTITGGVTGIEGYGVSTTIDNSGVIVGTSGSGIYLGGASDSSVSGYVTNTAGGTITGGAYGIDAAGLTATINNSGTITGTVYYGIYLQYTDDSITFGYIGNAATGVITGGTDGVEADGVAASIMNAGVITGTSGYGINLEWSNVTPISGYVGNAATGTITGGTDGIDANELSATIENAGLINGASGSGVYLQYSPNSPTSGYIGNESSGRITGGTDGIDVAGVYASIINAGVITGTTGSGIDLQPSNYTTTDGFISNAASGAITGHVDGIQAAGIYATIDNLGVITGTTGSGIDLQASSTTAVWGYVDNAGGGAITGGTYGIDVAGMYVTIDNLGVITGTSGSGIDLQYSSISATSGYIGNTVTGRITGGADGIDFDGVYASVANAGVITGTSGSGIDLQQSNYIATYGFIGNATTGTITGGADGLNFAGVYASIVNAGVITGTSGSGIQLQASSTTSISGYIGNSATGRITGGGDGIDVTGIHASIGNAGVITGTSASGIYLQESGASSVSGYISNAASGAITGHFDGIDVQGVNVTIENAGVVTGTNASGIKLQQSNTSATSGYIGNAATGTITGFTDGIEVDGVDVSIVTAGIVTGTNGSGIDLQQSDSITTSGYIGNAVTGTITGLAHGIEVAGVDATIDNAGLIVGTTSSGIDLLASDSITNSVAITNEATGVIGGRTDGVAATGIDATIVNAYLITGTTGDGIDLLPSATTIVSGYISNAATGVIAGRADGIAAAGIDATIINAYLITGTRAAGVYLGGSDSATVSGYISNATMGTIAGRTEGVDVVGANASVVNAGIITGTNAAGIYLGGSATTATWGFAYNGATGTIAGHADGIDASAVNEAVINAGVITGTTGSGIDLQASGSTYVFGYISNATTGMITGAVDGIDVVGVNASMINAGVITGTNGAGIDLQASGSTIGFGYIGNAHTGTIAGGVDGIDVSGQDGVIINAGVITGTSGSGIDLQAPGTSTTYGYISNAATGTISGDIDGIDVVGVTASIVNAGHIHGSMSAGIHASGAAGLVINEAGGTIAGALGGIALAAGGTVVNAGTILGGAGNAVYLGGTLDNRLVIVPGAVFDGIAVGGESASNTLELASAASAGTITGIGSSYTNFTRVTVDTGASWAFDGYNSLALGVTMTNDGTVTVTGTLSSDGTVVNDGLIAPGAGPLSTDALLGTGDVADDADNTVRVDDTFGAGGTISLAGQDVVALGDTAVAAGTISGFGVSDTIDLFNLTFDPSDQIALLDGNVLQVTEANLDTFDLQLDPADDFAGHYFKLSPDGQGGTDINLAVTPPAALTLAPSSDSGVAGDDITNVTTPEITGTGAVGDTIILYDGTTDIGTTTVDGDGAWSVTTAALAAGPHTLTATETDANLYVSAASDALDLTIDTTIPAAPAALTLASSSDSGVAGDDITNVATPEITGTGTPGDTVTLYDGTVDVGTATVGGDGAWSVTTPTLAAGPHMLTATQTDVAANVSALSATLDLTIDTTIPAAPAALTLAPSSDSGVAGDGITNVTTPEITGTGTPGDTIILHDGTVDVGTATVGGDGAWSVTAAALAAGPHMLTATQTEVAGNVSPVSSTLDLTIDTSIPAAPAGLTLAPSSDSGVQGDDITSVTTPTITGTGTQGDSVILYDGTIDVGTATVGADGTWSVTTALLTDGAHALTAVESDVAGNVSAAATLDLTIDSLPPPAPTLVETTDSTNPAEPVVDGTAPAGGTVTVYDGGVAVGTAIAGADGAWQFAFTTPISTGTHILTAIAIDVAGNVSPVSAPLTVQANVDTSYAVVSTPDYSGDTTTRNFDTSGQLTEIDTLNSAGQMLIAISQTQAIVDIYDNAGTLIGTITQPSTQAFAQPVFATQGGVLSAVSASGPTGSQIALIDESNVIVSQASDTISGGAGADTIFAAGPSIAVFGGSGSLLLVGENASTTVVGGTGSASVFGGTSGGVIQGGSAGGNILVAGGGNTTLLAGGSGDILAAFAGTAVVVMQGNDTAFGGAGASSLFGGGDGVMVGGGGDNLIMGGAAGNELMFGGAGSSTMIGGGADTMVGGDGPSLMVLQGNGSVFGGAGAATIFAGGGDGGMMVGGGGANLMFALPGGSETMWGGAGESTMFSASAGETTMIGGVNGTLFVGQGGAATDIGGAGNDTFFASGGGATTIIEGGGADDVEFGAGPTTVAGGSGANLYDVTAGTAGGADVITGFKPGTDQLRLFGYDPATVQQSVAGGNLTLTLSDSTRITLVGITQLPANTLL